MKVLHLIQHLKIGGLEKMAVTLMQKSCFAENSLIVALEGTKVDAFTAWPYLKGIEPQLVFLNKKPQFELGIVVKLTRIIDEQQIEVIHSHHIGPMLYASLACLMRKKVKHVSTIHDAWYLNNFKQRIFTKILNKLSAIHWVADAQVVADHFTERTSISTSSTILNGIDCKQFAAINIDHARYLLGLPKFVKIIGCAARLEPGKGHKTLINSFKELPDDYHLALAGTGSLKTELHAHIISQGLEERIHFLGNVQNMQVFYSAINVFCLFSEREGLPLTILEAMSCGVPVVATDVGGIHEVLTPEQGILLSPMAQSGLPFALIKAIKLNRGQSIRAHAIAIADVTHMSTRYDQLYKALNA
jgi:glycosyltransferase involved in cell wall biosynthesis